MKHVRKLFSALLTLALVCALVPLAQAGKWDNNGHFANNGSFKNEHDFVNGASGTILNEGEFLNSGAFSNANTASNAFSGTKKLLNRGGTVAGLGAGAYEDGSGSTIGSFAARWKDDGGSFEWDAVDGAVAYLFTVSSPAASTPLVAEKIRWTAGQNCITDAAMFLLDLPDSGSFTLTVKALDASDEALAASNVMTIALQSAGVAAAYTTTVTNDTTAQTHEISLTVTSPANVRKTVDRLTFTNGGKNSGAFSGTGGRSGGSRVITAGCTYDVRAMTATSVSGDTWSVTTTIPSVKTYNAATGNFETQGSNGSTDSVTVSVTNNIVYVKGTGAMRDYTTPTVNPTLTGARPWLTTENAGKLAHAQVGDGVTAIGDYTFAELSNLDSVTIDNSVERIGNYAFTDDIKLTGVALPSNLTEIGEQAFYGTGLTALTLPSNVESIGDGAFKQCTSLATVIIPASVESIGSEAFSGCASNLVVYYYGSEEDWGNIDAPADVFGGASPTIYFNYNPNSQP